MTYLRKHELDGKKYTAKELFNMRSCSVTMRDLTINLSKKRMEPAEAMVTPIQRDRKNTRKHFLHGLWLTCYEIADLKQCEISYWLLQQRIRCKAYTWDIDQAILKKGVPRLKIRKSLQTGLKKVYKQVLVGEIAKAKGSQVSLNYQPKKYDWKQSWEHIAARKFAHVLDSYNRENNRANAQSDLDY